jgi:NADH-quinone oxidoreductase subunit C
MPDDKTPPNGEQPPDTPPEEPTSADQGAEREWPTDQPDAKRAALEAAERARTHLRFLPVHRDASDDPDVVALAEAIEGSVVDADEFAGDVTVTVPRDRIVKACRFLKDELEYAFLVDVTAVDWPEREQGRFDVIYWMHRFSDSKRFRLRTVLPDDRPIASVAGVWKTANWMEREAYDMFGIEFDGHPGLERILTWEGFNGHPLRKDFPVEGIDTGAAIYPDVYPPGGGPVVEEEQGDAE